MGAERRAGDDVDMTTAAIKERLEHHLREMADWTEGRRSWTNLGPHEPYTPDVIAVMDAQEVAKHSYAVQAYSVALAASLGMVGRG